MSFARVHTLGWGFGEKLTSAQMNTLDIDHSNAVDKRVGAQEIDSHTVQRVQPLIPMAGNTGTDFAVPGKWFWEDSSLMWRATDPTTGTSSITVPLTNIPDKSTLTVVRFYIKGTGYTNLPSPDMPLFQLRYLDASGVVQSPAPGSVDDGASLGTFNTFHEITYTVTGGLAIDLTTTPRDLYARMIYSSTGSAGAGREFRLGRIECDFTITRLTPG